MRHVTVDGTPYAVILDLGGQELHRLPLPPSPLPPRDVMQIPAGTSLRGISLRHADLFGITAHGVDFRRADLTGARLGWSDLSGSNLEAAVLSGADCTQSKLMRVHCRGAMMGGARFLLAHLDDANLEDVDLRHADLAQSSLARAVLDRARLDHARLCRADLSSASLAGAVLSRANLRHACLVDARTSGRELEDIIGMSDRPACLARLREKLAADSRDESAIRRVKQWIDWLVRLGALHASDLRPALLSPSRAIRKVAIMALGRVAPEEEAGNVVE